MTQKKVCVMGTAPTWRQTPWEDTSWDIRGLNDGYLLNPKRYDRWYELHPFGQMWFRPKDQRVIQKTDIPKNAYVRPEGHLEWLKEQAQRIPVFLQAEPPADWPANAHRFPIEAVQEDFDPDYWASGPAYMVVQAVMEGHTEIMVTGIHLATESEYREQRPNFEHILGRLLGRRVKKYRENGFRIFEGDIKLWLPETTPILSHGWKYAYEHKPEPAADPYRVELKATVKAKNTLIEQLIVWPVGQSKDAALEKLKRLDVIEEDCRMQILRRSQAEQYGPIQAVLGG